MAIKEYPGTEIIGDDLTPEQAQWGNVLHTYVSDLESINKQLSGKPDKDKRDTLIHRKYAILKNLESAWTVEICDLLNLDHGYVVGMVKRLYFKH